MSSPERQLSKDADQLYQRVKEEVETKFSVKNIRDGLLLIEWPVYEDSDNAVQKASEFTEIDHTPSNEVILSKFKKYRNSLLTQLNDARACGHQSALSLMVRLELIYVQEVEKLQVEHASYSDKHWTLRSRELKAVYNNSSVSIEARCLSKLVRAELLSYLGDLTKVQRLCSELSNMIAGAQFNSFIMLEMSNRIAALLEKHSHKVSDAFSPDRRSRSSTVSSSGSYSLSDRASLYSVSSDKGNSGLSEINFKEGSLLDMKAS